MKNWFLEAGCLTLNKAGIKQCGGLSSVNSHTPTWLLVPSPLLLDLKKRAGRKDLWMDRHKHRQVQPKWGVKAKQRRRKREELLLMIMLISVWKFEGTDVGTIFLWNTWLPYIKYINVHRCHKIGRSRVLVYHCSADPQPCLQGCLSLSLLGGNFLFNN